LVRNSNHKKPIATGRIANDQTGICEKSNTMLFQVQLELNMFRESNITHPE
jgi:hypothetical protein